MDRLAHGADSHTQSDKEKGRGPRVFIERENHEVLQSEDTTGSDRMLYIECSIYEDIYLKTNSCYYKSDIFSI